eukprot:TRINITY_DN11931_c0_g1_i4.p1 TRINITY_DN11931_c0_g1~~TRINITY_DN11931_c0_g1_i4.p1  ORF type:complete len:1571 (-),score=142.43 TRINITY_DN11931_c0_g1_i4:10-4347(-)
MSPARGHAASIELNSTFSLIGRGRPSSSQEHVDIHDRLNLEIIRAVSMDDQVWNVLGSAVNGSGLDLAIQFWLRLASGSPALVGFLNIRSHLQAAVEEILGSNIKLELQILHLTGPASWIPPASSLVKDSWGLPGPAQALHNITVILHGDTETDVMMQATLFEVAASDFYNQRVIRQPVKHAAAPVHFSVMLCSSGCSAGELIRNTTQDHNRVFLPGSILSESSGRITDFGHEGYRNFITSMFHMNKKTPMRTAVVGIDSSPQTRAREWQSMRIITMGMLLNHLRIERVMVFNGASDDFLMDDLKLTLDDSTQLSSCQLPTSHGEDPLLPPEVGSARLASWKAAALQLSLAPETQAVVIIGGHGMQADLLSAGFTYFLFDEKLLNGRMLLSPTLNGEFIEHVVEAQLKYLQSAWVHSSAMDALIWSDTGFAADHELSRLIDAWMHHLNPSRPNLPSWLLHELKSRNLFNLFANKTWFRSVVEDAVTPFTMSWVTLAAAHMGLLISSDSSSFQSRGMQNIAGLNVLTGRVDGFSWGLHTRVTLRQYLHFDCTPDAFGNGSELRSQSFRRSGRYHNWISALSLAKLQPQSAFKYNAMRFRGCRGAKAMACPAGQQAGTQACELCPAGRHKNTNDEMACSNCVAGRFSQRGQVSCSACQRGRFSTLGLPACISCPPGASTSGEGASDCHLCEVGKASSFGEVNGCLDCELGSFASARGSSMCTACPVTLTTMHWGATDLSQCVCAPGQFLQNRFLPSGERVSAITMGFENLGSAFKCAPCPGGFVCKGGLTSMVNERERLLLHEMPVLLAGHYAKSDMPFQAFTCMGRLGAGVGGCPGVLPESCAGERSGLQCAFCQKGKFSETGAGCMECWRHARYLWLPLFVLLAPFALLHMHHMVNNGAQSSLLFDVLALAISRLQLITVMASMSTPAWAAFSGPVTIFFLLPVSLRDITSFECYFGDGTLVVRYVPSIVLLLALPTVFLVASYACHICGCDVRRDEIVNSIGTLCLGIYTLGIKTTFDIFECEENPSAPATLTAYPGFICMGEAVKPILPFAGSVFALLSSFLAIATWILLKAPRRVANNSFYRRWKFLFARWHPNCFRCGLIQTLRSFLTSLTPSVLRGPVTQLLCLLIITLICLLYQTQQQPWRRRLPNVLDTISGAFQIGLLCFALLHASGHGQFGLAFGACMILHTLTLVVGFPLAYFSTRTTRCGELLHFKSLQKDLATKAVERVLSVTEMVHARSGLYTVLVKQFKWHPEDDLHNCIRLCGLVKLALDENPIVDDVAGNWVSLFDVVPPLREKNDTSSDTSSSKCPAIRGLVSCVNMITSMSMTRLQSCDGHLPRGHKYADDDEDVEVTRDVGVEATAATLSQSSSSADSIPGQVSTLGSTFCGRAVGPEVTDTGEGTGLAIDCMSVTEDAAHQNTLGLLFRTPSEIDNYRRSLGQLS